MDFATVLTQVMSGAKAVRAAWADTTYMALAGTRFYRRFDASGNIIALVNDSDKAAQDWSIV